MHLNSPDQAFETHRIILLRGKGPEVLVGFEGTYRAFPSVQIPRGERIAEHITRQLRTTYSIDAVLLTSLEAPSTPGSFEPTAYDILEPCEPRGGSPLGKYWVPFRGLSEHTFRDTTDFEALQRAVTEVVEGTEGMPRTPFGRLGWFGQVEDWVEEKIAPHGLSLDGSFRQLNASPTFSLIRFGTNGQAVWFKAAGAPNQRELPLTLTLARLFPKFVPTVLATRPGWNAWLSLEAEGPLLVEKSCEPRAWNACACDLAELQLYSLGRTLHLLELGARDLRPYALRTRVEPFFEAMQDWMECQTKTSPPPLSREELRSLSARVQDALQALDQTNFPPCLGHLDLNPGNILAPLSGCMFLDWAEAFVGHPFLTFQYLREHFRRNFGPDTRPESDLVSCYSFRWYEFASEKQIQQALEVTPLVAVFAYAAGSDLWSRPQPRADSHAATYLRSLTRRMDREARVLAERSVTCPS